MKLFTVGPVEMYPVSLQIEGSQPPYFRTKEFSTLMLDIERWFLKSIHAPENTSFIGLTCSGTGAMESAVANVLTENDRALVIDGGSFGSRFVQICERFRIPTEAYHLGYNDAFNKERFLEYEGKGYTALLVNACETSTGQKYDLDFLGEFCKRNNMLFIVDAVSAYLADEIDMSRQGIDVLLTASQKALALAPGVALVAVSDRVYQQRIKESRSDLYYFDYSAYIENQKRGQPPFTSAVSTMLALHQRLEDIDRRGVSAERERHAKRAELFRSLARDLPVELPQYSLSNSCTPIRFPKNNAGSVFDYLKSRYELILTPSGGELKDIQLRVGHLGNLCDDDYYLLASKLQEVLML